MSPLNNPISEKIELIAYSPNLPTTGDLEAGTHTIVPIARPAIGAAQYSHSLTLSKPSDARLVVKRMAARLNVNIAGLGTATHVYCSVRVDVDDANHELFNEDWTSTGNKLAAVDTHSVSKPTIFDLLKNGAAHTFYFLFWADQASQATIDVVQLWEGVGTCITGATDCMQINHSGLILVQMGAGISGSGTVRTYFAPNATTGDGATSDGVRRYEPSASAAPVPLTMQKTSGVFACRTSVATDIVVCSLVWITLRSEQ